MSASKKDERNSKGARKVCCSIPLSALKPDLVSRIKRSSSKTAAIKWGDQNSTGMVGTNRTVRTKGAVKFFPDYMKYLEDMPPQPAQPQADQPEPVQDKPQSGPVKLIIRIVRLHDQYRLERVPSAGQVNTE